MMARARVKKVVAVRRSQHSRRAAHFQIFTDSLIRFFYLSSSITLALTLSSDSSAEWSARPKPS